MVDVTDSTNVNVGFGTVEFFCHSIPFVASGFRKPRDTLASHPLVRGKREGFSFFHVGIQGYFAVAY